MTLELQKNLIYITNMVVPYTYRFSRIYTTKTFVNAAYHNSFTNFRFLWSFTNETESNNT